MKKNIHVTKRPDGRWNVIKEGGKRASCITDTQEQARQKARELAIKEKVEVLIHRVDNKIRARDSYGNDPHPPKG
jgi:hypothetical protein